MGLFPNGKKVTVEMVNIPAGTFQMGSAASGAFRVEQPVHPVTLRAFAIGKYPVTQALWSDVMGYNHSFFKKGGQYPVENVSWDQAQEFIAALNRLTGMRYRLPTEAEWEYAARGETVEDRYNEINSIAWYLDNAEASTHPVGQKLPNVYDLYDMLGNVFEWCQDWYGPYPAAPAINPAGPDTGTVRILRGGSWSYFAPCCRATYRDAGPAEDRCIYIGFRLAADIL